MFLLPYSESKSDITMSFTNLTHKVKEVVVSECIYVIVTMYEVFLPLNGAMEAARREETSPCHLSDA